MRGGRRDRPLPRSHAPSTEETGNRQNNQGGTNTTAHFVGGIIKNVPKSSKAVLIGFFFKILAVAVDISLVGTGRGSGWGAGRDWGEGVDMPRGEM